LIKDSAELFIFDLDGTIVDSSKTVLKILNLIRKELKMSLIDLNDIGSALSLGGNEMISIALGEGVNSDYYLQYFRSIYIRDNLENEKVFIGVREFIEYLLSKDKKVALCTNKPKDLVFKVLKHHKLESYFDCIVTGTDVENKKPNPEGIIKIINKIKCNYEKVVLIGDSSVDQIAAKNAKIKFYFFEAGYDDGVDRKNIDLKFKCYKNLLGVSL
jgi:phosphoglycolate phosphatase